jgi:hypothetical protein
VYWDARLTSKFGKLDECSMTSNMGLREDLLGCCNLVKILVGSIIELSARQHGYGHTDTCIGIRRIQIRRYIIFSNNPIRGYV